VVAAIERQFHVAVWDFLGNDMSVYVPPLQTKLDSCRASLFPQRPRQKADL